MFQPSPASRPPPGSVPVPRGPRVWRIPRWDGMSNPEKITVISRIGSEAASDPRIQLLAVRIFKRAGVAPRDYSGQAAAILKFMQDNCYFVNETGEVLKDPAYVLDLSEDGTVGEDAAGDCDDQAGTVKALCQSVGLPVRLVTSGRLQNGRPVRWVEGTKGRPPRAKWGHIYNQIGNHPFRPTVWRFADATMPGAPLGWDVVGARGSDPQREFGDVGAGELGAGFGAFAGLVLASVASAAIVKQLERAGWI